MSERHLAGHFNEFERLLATLESEPGTTVVLGDPLSGATSLARRAADDLAFRGVFVDARPAYDAADLAMALADAGVQRLRSQAFSWWNGAAPPGDLEGLHLHRALAKKSGDLEDLRLGSGSPGRLLTLAVDLVVSLAAAPVVVFLDHLDDFLIHEPDPVALDVLRSAAQEHQDLNLVLIGRTGGPTDRALRDVAQPLYRSAEVHRIHRLDPARTVADLGRGMKNSEPPDSNAVAVAIQLASGVPAYVWSIVEFASRVKSRSGGDQALEGWRTLRRVAEPAAAGEFSVLRAVHPLAQIVVSATAAGIGPYTAPFNDGRIRAALSKLESVGVVWQPRPRDWAVADPVLAAWSKDNAVPWIKRRARAATSS